MTVQIREAVPGDAAAIAGVHVDTWRTTYRGIVPDAFLDSMDIAARTRRWLERIERPSPGVFTLALVHGGAVIGFAVGGPRRDGPAEYDGELHAIYLRAAHQGQGYGRSLVTAVARRLAAAGQHNMLIWVLAANPACLFYQALGGQEVVRRIEEIGGVELAEIGYGWPDLTPFLEEGT